MAYSKGAFWQDVSPASGSTVQVPTSDSGSPVNLCVNNPALLAALTFNFPVTGVADGQLVKIATMGGISVLTSTVENGGALQGLINSIVAGGNGIYQYRLSNKTWYRFSG